jgi:hypothetical protein
MEMLGKHPDTRPSSARQVAERLEQASGRIKETEDRAAPRNAGTVSPNERILQSIFCSPKCV